jgi:hypothetical protein
MPNCAPSFCCFRVKNILRRSNMATLSSGVSPGWDGTRDQCAGRGRYRLDRLIERYGIDAKLFEWSDEITADCPRTQARNLNDQCGARCPDLSKVV